MKNTQDMDKKMGLMQEGMFKIHEHMHKIIDAKNPLERERLVQVQREMIHQHMQSMTDSNAKNGSDTAIQIAKRAYALYERHGHREGHEKQD